MNLLGNINAVAYNCWELIAKRLMLDVVIVVGYN